MEKTVEQQIADVILEREIATLEIAGVTYKVAPPTIATLIMVSELVSTLPEVEVIDKDDPDKNKKIFNEVLHNARHYKVLGEIAAVLILGAKGLTEESVQEIKTRRFFGILRGRRYVSKTIDMKAKLAKAILEEVSPKTLFNLLLSRINGLELGSFFAITTSLGEANILRATREVEQ